MTTQSILVATALAFLNICLSAQTQEKGSQAKGANELAEKWQSKPTKKSSGIKRRGINLKKVDPVPAPKIKRRSVRLDASAAKGMKKEYAKRGLDVEYVDGYAVATVEVEEETAVTFNNITFDLNSAILKAGAKNQLDQIASAMGQVKGVRFLIEGHTCDIGAERENLDLSQRRATSVVNYLVRKGVNLERLIPLGFGEQEVIKSGNEVRREASRRVNIAKQISGL